MFKFYKILPSMRQAKQISEEEMAKILSITVGRLRLIEEGRLLPPAEMMISYSNAIGIDLEDLVLQLLNAQAKEFCLKAGLNKSIQFSFKEESCGFAHGAEAMSKFVQSRARSSQLLGTGMTPESMRDY